MKRLATFLALLLALALPAAAETIKLRLQDLTALKKLELRCVSDVKEIAVPVPERWTVKRMDLHLRYTSLKPIRRAFGGFRISFCSGR